MRTQIVGIESPTGKIPAAVACQREDGSYQVICLDESDMPNWVVVVRSVTEWNDPLTPFAIQCVESRGGVL